MNILVTCRYGYYWDLTSSFIHKQAKAYAQLGHRVRVLILTPIGKSYQGSRFGPSLAVRQADGVELYYLRYLSLSNLGKDWFNTSAAKAAIGIHLSTIFKDFEPEIIHSHTLGIDSEVGAYLRNKIGCPLIVTTHGSDTFSVFDDGKQRNLAQFAQKADAVVCVSSLLKGTLMKCSIDVPVRIILNGFCVNTVEGVCKSPLSIIQVGYLVERKKTDVTICALAELRKCYPDASLRIIGSGDQFDRLVALGERLNVEDSVRFCGFLPNNEVLSQMAESMFFVMPSVREGFGIVYLEAMANGCITIGTQGEGIADLIVSGENGFLVPPNDSYAIVKVIEWCLENPDEAASIAERGRADALNLTWERNAQQYIELFEELRDLGEA